MKKYLLALAAIVLTVSTFTSCKEKLKDASGVVTSVEASYMGDTVKSMKIYDGEDTLLFSLDKAQYTNGLMIKGDSVDIGYVKGNGDTLRALLVHVKPAPAKVVDIKTDTTKTLLTR